jgi:hypothetical protein
MGKITVNRKYALLCVALLFGTPLLQAQTENPAQSALVSAMQIEGYARETPPGSRISAAYLTLRNSGTAAQLQAVELPGHPQASAGLHTTIYEQGVSRMRALEALEIPAQSNLVMQPGGVHLMLQGIQLRAQEKLPLRLHFIGGGVIDILLPVHPLVTAGEHHHHG